jgi:hypothetical protein
MNNQTVLLIGLGSLLAAGVVVSVGGWVLFVRERRAAKAARASGSASEEPDGSASADEPVDDREG